MSTRYRDAPLVEAIFEFAPQRAVLSSEDAGLLRAELAATYSGRTDELILGGVKVQLSKGQASAESMQIPPRRRMWTPDGSRLVQFASELLVFNALKPYSHYVDYLPAMEDLFGRYSARTRPDGTRFLGQRYINQIQLPPEARPRDYFRIYPELPADLPAPLHPPFALNLQTEALSPGQVLVTLAFKGIEAEKPTYLLDIYARTPDDPQISFNWPEVRAWHDNAHEAVWRGFEFAITPQCRQFLRPEED